MKRWNTSDGFYHAMQRCRRCDTWIRRDVDMKSGKMELVTETYRETTRKSNAENVEPQQVKDISADNGDIK
jgi:hypothetical protein